MREEFRKILRENHAKLVSELDVSVTFLARLLSKGVITEEQKYGIESTNSGSEKVDTLVNILLRRPDAAYASFCDVLKIENSDLYDLLTESSEATQQSREPAWRIDQESGPNDFLPSEINAEKRDAIATRSSTPSVLRAGALSILEALGAGGYGIVYKAQHVEWGIVAYKKLHVQFIRDRDLSALKHEAEVQWNLNHPNIVRVLGIVLESSNYGIVLEFVGNGELLDYIRDNKPDLQFKLSASYDVCLALSYLHSLSPPLIHGDLKIENILLAENGRAKVCDFGFSKWKEYSRSHSKEKIRLGTVTHVPPELWKDSFLRKVESFDVYSFGICLWEILAGDKPFKGADPLLIKSWVLDNQRPNMESIPSETPAPISELMKQCWNENIPMRPKFSEVKTILEESGHIIAS